MELKTRELSFVEFLEEAINLNKNLYYIEIPKNTRITVKYDKNIYFRFFDDSKAENIYCLEFREIENYFDKFSEIIKNAQKFNFVKISLKKAYDEFQNILQSHFEQLQ